MRAFGPFPVGGTYQHLAIALATAAMKFVNWHGETINRTAKNSSVVTAASAGRGQNKKRGQWTPLKVVPMDTPEGVAENQAFLAAASSFFQVRLGALVTRPFFKAEAATRI